MATFSHVGVLASDIWTFFGPELVIFSVSIFFALAFQSASGHVISRKLKQKISPEVQQRNHPREPVVRGSNMQSIGSNVPWRERTQPGRTQSESQALAKTTTNQIEAIFAMTRGASPAVVVAPRVLQLYFDLRVKLGLSAEVKHSSSDVQEAFYSELQGGTALDLFTTLVQAAVRNGQPHLVERLLQDMVALEVYRPVAFYESAMKQLAGQKEHRLALAVYDRMSADGLEPSTVTYSCLVHFAADVGEHNRALEFFEKLRSRTTPSIRAYMTMLRLFAQQSDWPSALAAFRDMQNRNVAVDSLALNIMLSVGVSADQVSQAESLLIECEEKSNIKPDLVGYNILVKGYARRNDVESARRVMARASAMGQTPNAISFNTLIDALVRAHTKSVEVLAALDEMREAGLNPDKFTCSIIVRATARCPTNRTLSAALRVLAEANDDLDQRSKFMHYNSVLSAAISISENVLAMRCKTLMREKDITISAASKAESSGQSWRRPSESVPRLGEARPSQSMGVGLA